MSAPPRRHRLPLRDPAGDPIEPGPPPPPRDELDALLREWHHENAERAAAGRDRLLASLRDGHAQSVPTPSWSITVRRIALSRYAPLAAAAVIALALLPLFLISNKTSPVALAKAETDIIMAPDGGRLDAFDPVRPGGGGDLLGPCVLKHTDVNAVVSGPFTRVTLTQKYHNPHKQQIEAVYTFPLSHRGAVDRMTMTIGDRVIIGEVKERNLAREIYEAARETGRTASLLEQERPNIFTQSVANIEPGADVDITISYIEQLDARNGEFEFQFPTVVGPRYIPGALGCVDPPTPESPASSSPAGEPASSPSSAPSGFVTRAGLNIPAPATITPIGDVAKGIDTSTLAARIPAAAPIAPAPTPGAADPAAALGPPVSTFECVYPDGSREQGRLYASDVGEVAGRWFRLNPLPAPGAPFSQPTDQVPDANRITPMPTRPETRAGHDISITVTIDTGGPGLIDIESPLHKVTRQDVRLRPDGTPSRTTITLASESAIPNRDFVLRWRQASPGVTDSVFTTRTLLGDFFAVILQPPNRVEDAAAIPRDLILVLDTSGSMRGRPIEAAKAVARRLIASMRPQDRLNVVTFSGDTRVLWPEPRPGTEANRAEALAFFDHRDGSGGTEMMAAIESALQAQASPPHPDHAAVQPLRIVAFLTDGYVGNDHAIIDAIQRHRGTTRVFSIGVGNSVNRYLLDGMAQAGGGEADYILIPPNNIDANDPQLRARLDADIQAVADRLNQRTHTPVLTHITASLSPGLAAADIEPPLDRLPDLFDVRPIVLFGRLTAPPLPTPGDSSITLRGQTAAGAWERTIPIRFDDGAANQLPSPELGGEGGGGVVPGLWARARIDTLLSGHLADLQAGSVRGEVRAHVVQLGETFDVMSPFTSFVAVDHQRVTIDGRPVLVPIPIELPDSTQWDGFFGEDAPARAAADAMQEKILEAEKSELFGMSSLEMSLSSYAGRKGAGAVADARDWSTAAAPAPAATPPAPTAAPPAPATAPQPSELRQARLAPIDATVAAQAPGRNAPASSPVSIRGEDQSGRTKADAGFYDFAPSVVEFTPSLDEARRNLRDDISTQNLAAESFYNNISQQVEVTDSLGNDAPNRLAVVAGANFIAQNVLQGNQAAANRAQQLFQNRYPDAPLLNDAARLVAENDARLTQNAPVPPPAAEKDDAARTSPAGQAGTPAPADTQAPTPEINAFANRVQEASQRERNLLRRLDPRLYELLPAPSINALSRNQQQFGNRAQFNRQALNINPAQHRADGAEGSLAQVGDDIIVSILLDNVDDATLESLKAVGFRLSTRIDESLTVVGAISIRNLEPLALLPAVKRIEPATQAPGPAENDPSNRRGLNTR